MLVNTVDHIHIISDLTVVDMTAPCGQIRSSAYSIPVSPSPFQCGDC